MTSIYNIVSIKLCREVGNDDYIVLFNLGDCIVSSFEVIVIKQSE